MIVAITLVAVLVLANLVVALRSGHDGECSAEEEKCLDLHFD